MKKHILFAIKRLANKFGYDIKLYHPHFDLVLKEHGIKTVIDIGANNGQFALDIRSRLPGARIISFEPLSDCYEELQAKMAGDGGFQALNLALGDVKGDVEIHRSAFSPSSSLLPMADLHKKMYPKSVETRKEKIQVERLDDVIRNIAVEGPLLVKLDVQGYEDKVIAGGKETLSLANMILIETSFKTLYEGQPLYKDIYALLASLGFSYYGNNGQHWDPKTGELVYEDSIFVKD
ncbi:MAG: FkbM family methyltransferase [Candidatus Taylorbacteria bacterium]|nr:FkbM family methyltransferase [Candidatus Taylorbacteria bacterium]